MQHSRFLATLTHPADPLDGNGTAVHFADSTTTIRALRPELTSFEMAIASSNNAAVENISNDLPKRRQLGDAWCEMHYLQPAAHKIAAQTEDGGFTKLEPVDVPWGLISCALSNTKNSRRFAGRFAFGDLPEASRSDPDAPCHIRDWAARYRGVTFDAAELGWLHGAIEEIRRMGEKSIIFAEFRETPQLLAYYNKDVLGFAPDVINDDVTASSKHIASRQKRIKALQAKPGFGVIVLSPVAVGFGVNVQEANHVIYYTRNWNPANAQRLRNGHA